MVVDLVLVRGGVSVVQKVFERISRRDFLKYCGSIAAVLGLSELYVPQIARALTDAAKKPPIIWIDGQACTGCTISVLNSREPTAGDVILDTISIRFMQTIMASAGDTAIKTLEDTIEKEKGKYVLVVEGGVPTAEDGRFCNVGEKDGKPITFANWVKKAGKNALVVIAIGTCSSFGGIPSANPQMQVRPVSEVLKGTPVVNVSGCPPHPDWFVGTVVKLLLFGAGKLIKDLDKHGRPLDFYGEMIHDNCPRRHWFEAGQFVRDWNDPEQAHFCLLLKGCKGPHTFADCPERHWNDGTNWCIGANAPCHGCVQPEFYKGFAPLYEKMPDVSIPAIAGYEVSADRIGAILGIVTLAGIGVHFVGQMATGRLGKGGPREGGGK